MKTPASAAKIEGSLTIPRHPVLPAGMDFLRMRREGIELIRRLGSQQWTDYNTHDPGITLLEALLYTITDLTHRSRWDIGDLLAGAQDQPFHSARDILTVHSVTPDDYRRLLIDLDEVRNAWVSCRECACGGSAASVRGLYDIRVELETDELVGDLNDRLITRTWTPASRSRAHAVVVEVRFPRTELTDQAQFEALLELPAPLSIACIRLMRVRTGKSLSNVILEDEDLRRHGRNVFYATLQVTSPSGPITLQDVAIRLLGSTEARDAFRVADLLNVLEAGESTGIVALYQRKERLARAAVAKAKRRYHESRNLDEDLCRLSTVEVAQVAVCAEIDVTPDADIEAVQAKAWFAIERYLAPPISFFTLDELRKDGVAVEDIFNGPELRNGFIRQEDLEAGSLRRVVRASDILDELMKIEGVRSIGSLLLTRYDDEGNAVTGHADPVFREDGPDFDPDKASAAWLLYMDEGQQPRLYHDLSNFIFRKNGLPLSADQDEARDSLTQLRGAAERPKQLNTASDLPRPTGIARDAADTSPVQYLLPFTYGVGPEGLPPQAAPRRRAQAKQLKAYLMVYEQLLGNAFEQLAHLGELFSLSRAVDRTYFARSFDDAQIKGHDEVVEVLGLAADLPRLCETQTEFLDRRNAFLDHVMARFGLGFGEYALLLTNWQGESQAKRQLVDDKLSVLKAYPAISRGRAKAFDRGRESDPLLPCNTAVLKRRITLLLGYPDLRCAWTHAVSGGVAKVTGFRLEDAYGEVWVEGSGEFTGASEGAAARRAADVLLQASSSSSAYRLYTAAGGYRLALLGPLDTEVARVPRPFASVRAAQEFAAELAATASVTRMILVEHLLLRPKFPGDARYRECGQCQDADPWSFRLTVVMPGWSAPYNTKLEWRDFAHRTIREEVPAHILPKICWVGNDSWAQDPCEPVVDALMRVIEKGAYTAQGARPDCKQARACAEAAYETHGKAFVAWYADKQLRVFARETIAAVLDEIFAPLVPGDVQCELDLAPLWSQLRAVLVAHFVDVVVHGQQFTRFEQAWHAWLAEDARIDWSEELLLERLQAILASRLEGKTETELCECARSLLEAHGQAFAAWMQENLDRGRELDEFTPFAPPAIELCAGASPVTKEQVAAFLDERYGSYRKVSYRLTLLVRLLETLTNTYPAATLHDCDDGSDDNPVRLNQTALGSLAPGAGQELRLVPQPEPAPRKPSTRRPGRRKR